MDALTLLENWAQPLLAKMTPTGRRQLARTVGQALRRSQHARIQTQRNPDGTPFAARKRPAKTGRIKRRHAEMFQRIAMARHLKVKPTPDEVSVGFYGRVARIARVHQEGLEDEVRPGGRRVRYEQRQLLGFSARDREMVRDLLIDHLAR